MEREIKRLKRSRIPLVKVRWNSREGPSSPGKVTRFVSKQEIPTTFHKPASTTSSQGLQDRGKALVMGWETDNLYLNIQFI
ncbi:hypothetical protein Tco_0948798 [Tanacetum coccineum]